MALMSDMLSYCEQLLQPEQFNDYAPNGLQVEGNEEVSTLVTGVTACEALIDAAIELKADALLVHHGYFWRGESPVITGMKRARLAKLLVHNINLIGYHLPLDAHLEVGNNSQLASVLGIDVADRFALSDGTLLGFLSHFDTPRPADQFAAHVAQCLGREPLHIAGTQAPIHTLAWCTGAAQDAIELANASGANAFLTGEVSERTVHEAREMGMHFFAAGHHATERYGVQALGALLAEQFQLTHHFVDIDNPV